MKPKTIKQVLNCKFNDWLDSFSDDVEEDKKIKEILKNHSIITGGCIASMLLGESINDFDVYLDSQDAAFEVAKYYVEKFKKNPPPRSSVGDLSIFAVKEKGRVSIKVKSAGIAGVEGSGTEEEEEEKATYEYFEGSTDVDRAAWYVEKIAKVKTQSSDKKDKGLYEPLFLTSNAITLSDNVQIVIRFFGSPEVIHENYDFVHCTNYWYSKTNELRINKDALQSLINKELIYVGSKYPICSVIRLRKFLEREWTITAGQIFKICYQISKLDLDDLDTLRDQLVGVDYAYFVEVIKILNEAKENGKTIDQSYLFEVIDRVF